VIEQVIRVHRFPSTHFRSFQRQVCPVNHLHWYWQHSRPRDKHTNNNKMPYNQHTGPSEKRSKI